MGNLSFVNAAPTRRQTWKVVVDGRTLDDEQTLLDWLRHSCAGEVWYSKALFADKKSQRFVHNRKRNFTDGYLQYTIWFAKKGDAALCRMFWDLAT